jgi:hypothetical protein
MPTREEIEEMMAREGRVYIVRNRAQLATAISRLRRLATAVDAFKSRRRLGADEIARYDTAVRLLEERIRAAESVDVRPGRRVEV